MMHGQERMSLAHSEKMNELDPQIRRNFDLMQNRWNQTPTFAEWEWWGGGSAGLIDLTTGLGDEYKVLAGLYPYKDDPTSGPEGCVDFIKEHDWTELVLTGGGRITQNFTSSSPIWKYNVWVSSPGKWNTGFASVIQGQHPYPWTLRNYAIPMFSITAGGTNYAGTISAVWRVRVRELPWNLYYASSSFLNGYMDPGTEGIPAGRYRVYPVWEQQNSGGTGTTGGLIGGWLEIREVPPRVPPYDR